MCIKCLYSFSFAIFSISHQIANACILYTILHRFGLLYFVCPPACLSTYAYVCVHANVWRIFCIDSSFVVYVWVVHNGPAWVWLWMEGNVFSLTKSMTDLPNRDCNRMRIVVRFIGLCRYSLCCCHCYRKSFDIVIVICSSSFPFNSFFSSTKLLLSLCYFCIISCVCDLLRQQFIGQTN